MTQSIYTSEGFSMQLPPGKIPVEVLKEVIFKNLGAKRGEVVQGPRAGIDGAVINIGNKALVSSMDPITGAVERIGWLAVNINANDVATFGVEPAFFLSCIMLPTNAEKATVETISAQMNKAAEQLKIAIIGGHCEVTPWLKNPIIVGCAMGISDKGHFVTAAEAKPGDKLILTKSAGIEGTAILASDKENKLKKSLSAKTLKNAKEFYKRISIVKEAMIAFETGEVHAMHDPTEGGIAGAIHEMADASKTGVTIHEDRIRVEDETQQICNFFNIDPLQLIASGCLLIAVEPNSAQRIVKTLATNSIDSETIGDFTSFPEQRRTVLRGGRFAELVRPKTDHLWRALAQ